MGNSFYLCSCLYYMISYGTFSSYESTPCIGFKLVIFISGALFLYYILSRSNSKAVGEDMKPCTQNRVRVVHRRRASLRFNKVFSAMDRSTEPQIGERYGFVSQKSSHKTSLVGA